MPSARNRNQPKPDERHHLRGVCALIGPKRNTVSPLKNKPIKKALSLERAFQLHLNF